MTLPQLTVAAAGIVLCLGSGFVFLQHHTRRFKALFWLAIGVAMVYAGFRPTIIERIGPDSIALRLRLIVALLSFIVLTVTLEAIRIARMQERYAFLWLATGLLLLGGAMFPDLAETLQALTGIGYGEIVLVVIFTFILLMLFHFSVAHSRTRHQLAQVARELALAEERLRRLEASSASPSKASPRTAHDQRPGP